MVWSDGRKEAAVEAVPEPPHSSTISKYDENALENTVEPGSLLHILTNLVSVGKVEITLLW